MGNDLAVGSSCAERVESSFAVVVVAKKKPVKNEIRVLESIFVLLCNIQLYTDVYGRIHVYTQIIQTNTYIYKRIRYAVQQN